MTATTKAPDGGLVRGGGLTRTGRVGSPASGRPFPLRWLALLLVPLLAGLGWWWFNPGTLEETQLVGARGPGCVRLVIAADVSGSMTALARPRDAAVEQLLGWAPDNLRPADELALLSFGATSAVDIAPTRVDATPVRSATAVSGDSTRLAPLVAAIGALPDTRCRTALLLVGDGQFADLPADEPTATAQLAGAGVDTIDFLVPGRTAVPPQWESLYPSAPSRFFDGTDPDETALTFGRQLAHLTQQQLQRTTD